MSGTMRGLRRPRRLREGFAAVLACMLACALSACGTTNLVARFGWCNDSDGVVQGMRSIHEQTGGKTVGFLFGSEYLVHEDDEDVAFVCDITERCDHIAYHAAPVSMNGADTAAAEAFIDWMRTSDEAKSVLEKRGYVQTFACEAPKRFGAKARKGDVLVICNFSDELKSMLEAAQKAYRKLYPDVNFENVIKIDPAQFGDTRYGGLSGLGAKPRKACAISVEPKGDMQQLLRENGWVEPSDYVEVCSDTLVLVTTDDQLEDVAGIDDLVDARGVCMVSTRQKTTGSGKYARQVLYNAGLIPSADTEHVVQPDFGDN